MAPLNSRKRFFCFVFISISIFLAQGTAFSQNAVVPNGDGTAASPYQIAELGNLVWMSDNVSSSSGKCYTMTADIALSSIGFVPIGTSGSPFLGTFDGAGHTITGLTIDRDPLSDEDQVGLFGSVGSSGVVKNVGLVGVSVGGKAFNAYVGGLVGENAGTVSNAYAVGDVRGISCVGGLVGNNHGTMVHVYANGTVTGLQDNIGGLVGLNSGTITNAYATSTVDGSSFSNVGGLIGYNSGGTVSYVHAVGFVGGYSTCRIGGLIGYNVEGTVSNAYAAVKASSGEEYSAVGGLVGHDLNSTVTNAYATGAVMATGKGSIMGGLIGYSGGSTITGSYWDTQTSGLADSYGGTGKTTVEMKQQATFCDWDFATIWAITENGSYPYFRVIGLPAGTLSIDTTPIKGEIFVDNDLWGTSPQSREIAVGRHTVIFNQVEGYRTPDDQTVTIEEGKTASITGTYTIPPGNNASPDDSDNETSADPGSDDSSSCSAPGLSFLAALVFMGLMLIKIM